jgi:hypothetical protein
MHGAISIYGCVAYPALSSWWKLKGIERPLEALSTNGWLPISFFNILIFCCKSCLVTYGEPFCQSEMAMLIEPSLLMSHRFDPFVGRQRLRPSGGIGPTCGSQ